VPVPVADPPVPLPVVPALPVVVVDPPRPAVPLGVPVVPALPAGMTPTFPAVPGLPGLLEGEAPQPATASNAASPRPNPIRNAAAPIDRWSRGVQVIVPPATQWPAPNRGLGKKFRSLRFHLLAPRLNDDRLDKRASFLILASNHAVPLLHVVIVVVERRAVISAVVVGVVCAPGGTYRMIQ